MSVSVRYFKAEYDSTRTVVMIAVRKADLIAAADGRPGALLYGRFVAKDSADAQPVEFLKQELFHLFDEREIQRVLGLVADAWQSSAHPGDTGQHEKVYRRFESVANGYNNPRVACLKEIRK